MDRFFALCKSFGLERSLNAALSVLTSALNTAIFFLKKDSPASNGVSITGIVFPIVQAILNLLVLTWLDRKKKTRQEQDMDKKLTDFRQSITQSLTQSITQSLTLSITQSVTKHYDQRILDLQRENADLRSQLNSFRSETSSNTASIYALIDRRFDALNNGANIPVQPPR